MSDKSSNKNNSIASSESSKHSGGDKSSTMGGSSKNGSTMIQSDIKGSFQLDAKDKEIVGDKKWVHLSLLFIPFGILASIVILLWAFYYSGFRIETGDSQDETPLIQENTVEDVIPLTEEEKLESKAPPISSDERAGLLDNYFGEISDNYDPNYLNDLPDEAVDLYISYDGQEDEVKKKVAAEEFFILLNQPLRDSPQDGFDQFLKDVQNDLESTLGELLFD